MLPQNEDYCIKKTLSFAKQNESLFSVVLRQNCKLLPHLSEKLLIIAQFTTLKKCFNKTHDINTL